jgi:2-amino-4-hydroxy-6-hydroxymethyldihydropteridine diphosphokinase
MIYYLGLGSNIGDRFLNIKNALDFLSTLGTIIKISSLYETEPEDMAPGTKDFYNLVLSLESNIDPFSLLKKIKSYEELMGRDLLNSHNKPRTIDIDILLAGNELIEAKNLIIPHKEMINRGFVLIPMKEIAPEVLHPVLKKTIADLVLKLNCLKKINKIASGFG